MAFPPSRTRATVGPPASGFMSLPSPPGASEPEASRHFGPCRLELRQGDLTAEHVDAVVNAANAHLAAGAGVCGAIRRVGGASIFEECAAIVKARGPLATGDVALTGAGDLPARHVIHAVGPVWRDGASGEALALASCYRKSLALAAVNGMASVAFPSIATGIYGYPVAEAARVALQTVREWMLGEGRAASAPSSVTLVRFMLFSEADLAAYRSALRALPA